MGLMQWFDLVNSIGIDAKRLDPMTVYLLGGKIMRERRGGKAIEKMTAAELKEFRERILGN
jgi:hypothetical protein